MAPDGRYPMRRSEHYDIELECSEIDAWNVWGGPNHVPSRSHLVCPLDCDRPALRACPDARRDIARVGMSARAGMPLMLAPLRDGAPHR
ncbi:hypothetical protein Micau_2537 [Micromonospora aurantiaca ATCC 27029]|nr:hypothetical protein Micau_2537 [Micromonospora aurantiaca ATCC 27029]